MVCLIASTSLKVKIQRPSAAAGIAIHLSDARASPLSAGAQSNPELFCANILIDTAEDAGIYDGFPSTLSNNKDNIIIISLCLISDEESRNLHRLGGRLDVNAHDGAGGLDYKR